MFGHEFYTRFFYDRKSTFLGRVTTLSLRKTVHLPPDLQNQYTAIIENFCNTLRVDGVKSQVVRILIMYLHYLPLRSHRTAEILPFPLECR